jgi:cation transport ATPase
MRQSSVIHGPGHEPGQPNLVAAWPVVFAAAAGAWAIDRYTTHALGAWRYIPVVVLGFYAVAASLIMLLMISVTNEPNLALTEKHLVLRRWLRRQRWAWTELRDVRIVEIDDQEQKTVSVLTLVPVRGPLVALPDPFRANAWPRITPEQAESEPGLGKVAAKQERIPAELDQVAEQLSAELGRRNPTVKPLDADAFETAARELRESVHAEKQRKTRRGWIATAVFWLVAVAALVVAGLRFAHNPAGESGWQRLALIVMIVYIGQFALVRGALSRFRERWREAYRIAVMAVGIVLGLLIAVLR